jgi:hypothetical protein
MYWRIPSNFQEIKDIVSKKESKVLGFKTLNKEGNVTYDFDLK